MKRLIPVAALLAIACAWTAPTVLGAAPKAPKAAPAPTYPEADWRTPDPDNILVIDTSRGRVIVEMTPFSAPNHVDRIKTLTRARFYDGQEFFRVIEGFMDQTGDPTNLGTGGSDLPDLKDEFEFRRGSADPWVFITRQASAPGVVATTELGLMGILPVRSGPSAQMMLSADGKTKVWPIFCAGVMGMAKASPPDTANSQFFLMRASVTDLDHNYTAWGRVLSGMEVVRAIKVGEPPAPPRDTLTTVRLLSDLPPAERPTVKVLDTRSASFKDLLAKSGVGSPVGPSICDLDIPVLIAKPS
ncbi:peptidylprolyl isomerase [Caulobacter ginsengisoli]|uniref:peptidylprolyl isomerase n=1 Tax=Caulobacter ginsengisoli TaxID=400775 RepID=A0ABU0IPL0_9CAUL|nr:peptidylprolyl isomerase [Caulobacter ginsengisoli]MDQ0463942.1 peptidylprolyl isomerase [Caulobacter ginsengisoli]